MSVNEHGHHVLQRSDDNRLWVFIYQYLGYQYIIPKIISLITIQSQNINQEMFITY